MIDSITAMFNSEYEFEPNAAAAFLAELADDGMFFFYLMPWRS